jgi:hypothetical protein
MAFVVTVSGTAYGAQNSGDTTANGAGAWWGGGAPYGTAAIEE